jgi:glutathione S-transferase
MPACYVCSKWKTPQGAEMRSAKQQREGAMAKKNMVTGAKETIAKAAAAVVVAAADFVSHKLSELEAKKAAAAKGAAKKPAKKKAAKKSPHKAAKKKSTAKRPRSG